MPEKKYTDEVMNFIKTNAHKGKTWLINEIKEKFNIQLGVRGLQTQASICNISLKAPKYPDRLINFIKENSYKGKVWLSNNIEKEFGMSINVRNITYIAKQYKIKMPVYKGLDYSTRQFIIENFSKHSYEELSILTNEKFNTKFNSKSMRNFCKNIGLRGHDVYLENNYNRLPIGSERIHTRSSNNKKTIFIRYRDIPITKDSLSDKELNWMPKTRWVWEQHNGPIPDNHCIIQLDGDYTNCSIENLRCISKNILAKINRMCGLGIITDAMIEILKLEEDLNEANRKR